MTIFYISCVKHPSRINECISNLGIFYFRLYDSLPGYRRKILKVQCNILYSTWIYSDYISSLRNVIYKCMEISCTATLEKSVRRGKTRISIIYITILVLFKDHDIKVSSQMHMYVNWLNWDMHSLMYFLFIHWCTNWASTKLSIIGRVRVRSTNSLYTTYIRIYKYSANYREWCTIILRTYNYSVIGSCSLSESKLTQLSLLDTFF